MADDEVIEKIRKLEWNAPYFDARSLPDPRYEYVAWIDLMGSASGLTRSLPTVANHIFKLHDAALDERERDEALFEKLRLYPVMDGLYAVTEKMEDLQYFLRCVFRRMAVDFLKANQPHKRALVRSGYAFGPVIHGSSIGDSGSIQLRNNPEYARRILLGGAMVQAYQMERAAPPFGVAVHETARTFTNSETSRPFTGKWFRWWQRREQVDAIAVPALLKAINTHFDWCSNHSDELDYPTDRLAEHRKMTAQYFDFAGHPLATDEKADRALAPALDEVEESPRSPTPEPAA
jgi:hypothetical protein